MIKPIRAIAVVDRNRPRIDVLDIFSFRDRGQIRCSKNEMAIEVMITPVDAPKAGKKGHRTVRKR